ncbi:SIMPL domain-containing protein [Gorillibacterium timonense]|uniref:SIMPL domain-containing protein n=1 Tax=Gorillibacterium timonense TaxID=1689269 RepID=UPI001F2279AD|nr:SIMPL domain-containing protein [Gorillibacterium timonense]
MPMYNSYPQTSPTSKNPATTQTIQSSMEVTGEGTVSAAPNRAIIVLGVITENPDLSTAQTENAAAVTKVINALLGLHIPREQIQTVTYRIEMQYSFEDGTQTFKGYQVTHLLQITLDRVEQTGLVVDTAVTNGANVVSSIRFALSNPDLYYNQALSIAIQNAGIKASTIARTLGATLIKTPVKITEEPGEIESPIPIRALAEGAAIPTPIQPGELDIRAVIRAKYTYF